MAGNCVLGPVLRLGATDDGVWQVHLMLVHVAGAAPQVTGVESVQAVLATVQGHAVLRYSISVTQTAAEQHIAYQVDGVPYEFVTPPVAGAPTCAYVSCNGFSDPKLMKCIVEVNAMWRHMAGRHALRPFHVLLMGGDQVYSDGMWQTLAPLKAWSALTMAKRIAAKFTPAMAAQVEAYFFRMNRIAATPRTMPASSTS